MEDTLWKIAGGLLAALFGALLSRLWDALRFEARFVDKEELWRVLSEFEGSKLTMIRERLSTMEPKLDAVRGEIIEVKTQLKSLHETIVNRQ